MNLQKFRLRDCHGLLFEGPRDPASDMAPLFARPEFDFGDYVLDHVEAPVQLQLENLHRGSLEDYHVGPFHPGLLRHLRRPTWEFNDWYSLQKVGVHNALAQRVPRSTSSGMTGCCRSARATRPISARSGSRISRPT